MVKMQDVKVGDELLMIGDRYSPVDGNGLTHLKCTKVGRKYTYFEYSDLSYPNWDDERFEKDEVCLGVFRTLQDYKDYKEMNRLFEEVRKYFCAYNSPALKLETLRKIKSLIEADNEK